MNIIRTFILIILLSFTYSCNSQKTVSNNKSNLSSLNYNTEFNSEYFLSVGTEYGVLEKEVYEQIKIAIELELSTTIPKRKSILINFRQNGRNCHSMRNNGEIILDYIKRGSEISSRISSQNRTIDFFVFSKNNFFNDLIKMDENFIIDTGFFYTNIFTAHENCSAFLIIKPMENS